MSVTACPIETVAAPAEVVWSVLSRPEAIDRWADAKLVRAIPEGPLAAGQRIELSAGPLGAFRVWWDIKEVAPAEGRIRMLVTLPFGVLNDETITWMPLGPDRCRVQFG